MTLDPARWSELERLFHAALEQPRAERAAFLRKACSGDPELRAELERLMAADAQAAGGITRIVGEGAAAAAGEVGVGMSRDLRIGAYRLVRELGRGGMGTVWLAERVDAEFQQSVAIKVMLPGLTGAAGTRRFRAERQILAGLQHPNIAQLFDGGTTEDGRPYLIMEYIEGEPIDGYCDRHNLGIDARIRLFRAVCSAVQFAHARLIVHRDIKPINILVTQDGTPKLLDFGIAKILAPTEGGEPQPKTATGLRMLTPPYASPEQLRGDPISTATDVYSLGVVLYELLTGRSPYRVNTDRPKDLAAAILTMGPERPSAAVTRPVSGDQDVGTARGSTAERLRRRLVGDLDAILLTALSKEPEGRYASVEQLAADLDRYQTGLPVSARPVTWSYRASKFVRRNGAAVGATLALFLTLVAAALSLGLQTRRIASERDTAERERVKAERVAGFLVDVFQSADPNESRGMEVTAREILARGGERVATELADQPEVQASAMEAIGKVYRALGQYDSAQVFLDGARERHEEVFGPASTEYARSLDELGSLARLREDWPTAERYHREALAIRRAALGEKHEDVARSISNVGVVLHEQGELAPAESLYLAALDLRTRLLGRQHAATATSLDNLGNLYNDLGRYDEAITVGQEAIEIRRRLFGTDHLDVAYALNNLGSSLEFAGRLDEAEPHYRESLAIRAKLLPAGHPSILVVMNNLAGLWLRNGDYAEAVEMLQQVVPLRRANGEHGMGLATPLSNLGVAFSRLGRHAEAIPLFRESIGEMAGVLGPRYVGTTFPMNGLAGSLAATGQSAEAERIYREVVEIRREAYGEEGNPNLVFSLDVLGSFLLDRGRAAEAQPLLSDAVRMGRGLFTQPHTYQADALASLGRLHLLRGRPAEAEPLLREALELRRGLLADGHPNTARAASLLGRALVELGRVDEAAPLLRESLPVLEEESASEQQWLAPARAALAEINPSRQ